MDQARRRRSDSGTSWTSEHHAEGSAQHWLPVIGGVEGARNRMPPDRMGAHVSAMLVETMGYLQLLVAELMGGGDLATACARGAQVLKDLAAALEQAIGLNSGENERREATVAVAGPARAARRTEHGAHGAALTRREREVMKRVEKGDSYIQIAKRLDISVQTVYKHVGNARRKRRDSQSRTILSSP